MNLLQFLDVHAGGPGSGCNPAAGKCGRPAGGGGDDDSGGGGSTGESFVSPNEGEGGDYESASKALGSDQQKEFVKQAQSLLDENGGGTVDNAIGDWSDGAENSAVLTDKTDPETRDYIASQLGLARNQKAVLTFQIDPNGKDAVHSVNISGDPAQIRAKMDELGLQYRTLIPHQHSITVTVFDGGNELADKFAQLGDHFGSQTQTIRGTGKFIGGETRAEGKAAYEKIIHAYRHHKRSVKSGSQGPIVHRRTKKALTYDDGEDPSGNSHAEDQAEKTPRLVPRWKPVPTPAGYGIAARRLKSRQRMWK